MDSINTFLNDNLGDNYFGITLGIVSIIILIVIGFFADRVNKRNHQETKANENKALAIEIKQNQATEPVNPIPATVVNQDMSSGLNMPEQNNNFEKTEIISQGPISPNQTINQNSSKDELII